MTRFFIGFSLILIALFALELWRPIQEAVVIPWTGFLARSSAWVVHVFDPSVIAYRNVLQSPTNGAAVAIEAGCNGVEAAIVLTAAIMAFPAPWGRKLAGLAIGFVAIQSLNLVRIISLFYLLQWNETAFEWAHLYVWQAMIMLDALIVFLIWLRTLPARQASEPVRHAQ